MEVFAWPCETSSQTLVAPPEKLISIQPADESRLDAAYQDIVSRFWIGTARSGHILATINVSESNAIKVYPVDGWKIAQVMNFFYSYWKITGAHDARLRMAAEWAWHSSSNPSYTDLSACGDGAKNNYLADDTAWNIGWLLQVYEMLGDNAALRAAKGALDCAYTHWWDSKDGGFWYSDHGPGLSDLSEKSSYQMPLILDFYRYYQLTGNLEYAQKAIAGDRWTADNLQRNGQIVNGQLYPDDGLYWAVMNANGTIQWIDVPYHIEVGSSAVLLVADMTAAVMSGILYAETNEVYYKDRAIRIARGIKAYETTPDGTFFDARDLFVDGWAMYWYAVYVLPLLKGQLDVANGETMRLSAETVWNEDRLPDRSFGGDWGGQPITGPAWATLNSITKADWPQTSANATMVILGGHLAHQFP